MNRYHLDGQFLSPVSGGHGTRDPFWAQSVRDTVSLTLFLVLSFSGFALIQVVGWS